MNQAMQALQQTLYRDIPLSQHMGITVASYDGEQLVLKAPLTPNVNHKSTVFGGSLYSLAVLCGWGLLHLKLKELGLSGHIVIHEANMHYAAPVKQDFQARCRLPANDEFKRFVHQFQRRRKARITLAVEIPYAAAAAATLHGSYVLHAGE